MINGHALCPPLAFVAAIAVGPEPPQVERPQADNSV